MRRVPAAVAATALLAGVIVGGVSARTPSSPAYQVADVGAYGGEPSIVSDTKGVLYDTTPSGGTTRVSGYMRKGAWADAQEVPDLASRAEWATRAPSLEADIAAAGMGLDDLGHCRVLYGCLEPLGDDPRKSLARDAPLLATRKARPIL